VVCSDLMYYEQPPQ